MADFDALLDIERRVLREAGLAPDRVAEIVGDAGRAISLFEDWPDEFAVGRVRETVSAAARAACMEAGLTNPRRPTRRLRRGMKVASGTVLIFANASWAPDGFRELSILAGEGIVLSSAQAE